MNKKFTGIMPALATPLCEDNKTILEESVKKAIDMQLEGGATGFYVMGGTGEGIATARAEREIMCELAVKYNAGRGAVINHIASTDFNEAMELARHAERAGCDAIAAIPPVFLGYRPEELYEYYKKLASCVNIPLIVYYHPGAQPNMSAELIAKIFEVDNVTGVKWSSHNFLEMMKLKDLTKGEMNIINGPDELLCLGLMAGADGGIGTTYNIMTPEFVNIYNQFKSGDIAGARTTQFKVNRIIELLIKSDLLPATKHAMGLMGVEMGDARFPFKHLSQQEIATFEAELKRLGWTPDGKVL